MSTSPTTSIRPQFRTFGGLRTRYADTGASQEPTLLLTSPWPESLYAFRRVWDTLAAHARLFAIDLPGFGASQRRDDLLSPRAMAVVLIDAGHFVWEEAPAEYSSTILDSIQGKRS